MEARVHSLGDMPGLHTAFLNPRPPNPMENVGVTPALKFKPFSGRRRHLKLRFRTISAVLASDSSSRSESSGSFTVDRQRPETVGSEAVSSVKPVYVPTPPNRDLRTPHSG